MVLRKANFSQWRLPANSFFSPSLTVKLRQERPPTLRLFIRKKHYKQLNWHKWLPSSIELLIQQKWSRVTTICGEWNATNSKRTTAILSTLTKPKTLRSKASCRKLLMVLFFNHKKSKKMRLTLNQVQETFNTAVLSRPWQWKRTNSEQNRLKTAVSIKLPSISIRLPWIRFLSETGLRK